MTIGASGLQPFAILSGSVVPVVASVVSVIPDKSFPSRIKASYRLCTAFGTAGDGEIGKPVAEGEIAGLFEGCVCWLLHAKERPARTTPAISARYRTPTILRLAANRLPRRFCYGLRRQVEVLQQLLPGAACAVAVLHANVFDGHRPLVRQRCRHQAAEAAQHEVVLRRHDR